MLDFLYKVNLYFKIVHYVGEIIIEHSKHKLCHCFENVKINVFVWEMIRLSRFDNKNLSICL